MTLQQCANAVIQWRFIPDGLAFPASARSGLPRLSPNTNKRLILAPYDTCLRMRLLLQTYHLYIQHIIVCYC